MKTIITATVLLILSAPAWADEAETQTKNLANTDQPIVLSEADMDGVTAAGIGTSPSFTIYSDTSTHDRPTEEVSFSYAKISFAYVATK